MPYNTLSPTYGSEDYVDFDGEVELTGVLEYSYNTSEAIYERCFYPDKNLMLPFLTDPYKKGVYNNQLEEWDYRKVSFNEKIDFCVTIADISANTYYSLPDDLRNKRVFGATAARVQVLFRRYRIVTDVYMRAAEVVEFKILSPTSIQYYDIDKLGSSDMQKWRALPITKDSYINLRGVPKENGTKIAAGEIINQIQVKDLQGKTPKAYIYIISSGTIGDWRKVFYFPPSTKSGKDAIIGYIHTSQIERMKR